MSETKTAGPRARYKVEHCDTRGVWVPVHRGLLKSHKSALAKKQAFCRVLVDYLGNGVWEEIESFPTLTAEWEAEKREMARSMAAVDATYDIGYMEDGLAHPPKAKP